MQVYFRSRQVRQAFRDWILGLGLFVVLASGLSGDPRTWGLSNAAASDQTAQAIDVTSPPGLGAENSMLAAFLQPPAFTAAASRPVAMTILGLTFSFMFAFNLWMWRHLRRVYASPRRGS